METGKRERRKDKNTPRESEVGDWKERERRKDRNIERERERGERIEILRERERDRGERIENTERERER